MSRGELCGSETAGEVSAGLSTRMGLLEEPLGSNVGVGASGCATVGARATGFDVPVAARAEIGLVPCGEG